MAGHLPRCSQESWDAWRCLHGDKSWQAAGHGLMQVKRFGSHAVSCMLHAGPDRSPAAF